jgi:hypothetical protein
MSDREIKPDDTIDPRDVGGCLSAESHTKRQAVRIPSQPSYMYGMDDKWVAYGE